MATDIVNIADYATFLILFITTIVLGLYLSFSQVWKTSTTNDQFLGGRSISIIPLTLSSMASTISGLGFIGFTAHFYTYGLHLAWAYPTVLLTLPLFVNSIVVLLYKLQATSVFQAREVKVARNHWPGWQPLEPYIFFISGLLPITSKYKVLIKLLRLSGATSQELIISWGDHENIGYQVSEVYLKRILELQREKRTLSESFNKVQYRNLEVNIGALNLHLWI